MIERLDALSPSRHDLDKDHIRKGYAEQLAYGQVIDDQYNAQNRDRYRALAGTIRDRLIARWFATQRAHHDDGVKRVYYLSLEFLMGRALANNVLNLGVEPAVMDALKEAGCDWAALCEEEVDAGLGNGGLGRLAACFIDSLATLNLPAMGYGLRYHYGIFRQSLQSGYQIEHPDDWLMYGNPWEVARTDTRVPVRFGGRVEQWTEGGRLQCKWVDAATVIGIPYDTPIVGYGATTVNTLRLWEAHAADDFDLADFNQGEYMKAVEEKTRAETLTKVLYPNDLNQMGKELRLRQQYLFVACSLWDIVRRFRHDDLPWADLPQRAAIQLNDTHPSLAVPELMRLLVDEYLLDWDQAWELTVATLGYTNHTLMPEALEKWPVSMMERLLPRHLQIIYEINSRFMERVAIAFPGDFRIMRSLSLIEESEPKQIRMANVCIVGSHSTNGVAALHTELLKSRVVPEFARMYPERFNSKTNGITQRRWLNQANPKLAELITETIGGKEWITNLSLLKKLEPLADDPAFQDKFMETKRQAKIRLIEKLQHETRTLIPNPYECQIELTPDMIFDVQVKRMHEYKRQLLNAIHIVMLYNRLRKNPDQPWQPQAFLFGGKAAPGYEMAKLIVKLIANIGRMINNDPAIGGKMKVHFIPNYRVSLAECIIPAADVSEQISTAGTEASGTGNMKFMLNGALTIGTLDGANIEIMEEAGRENMFIFGLNAEEVRELAKDYNPYERYMNNPEIKEALDLIFSGHFSIGEPGIFDPIRQSLLEWGDRYMLLADLPAYAEAQQNVQKAYADRRRWARMAILNVANAGKFSSDRTIMEYATDIWGVRPHIPGNGVS